MRTGKRGLIGLFSIVFLLGGVTMVTPLGSVAQAASPAGLIADHDAEMTVQHEEIKTEIGAQHAITQGDIADTQTAIAEVKALVEALEPGEGPVCPEGGTADASGRYKTYDADATDPKKVCDMTTGLFWEQSPDGGLYNVDPGTAQAHCAALGAGGRVPEVLELVGVVDYTVFAPAVNMSVFSNVQSVIYWSASLAVNGPTAWYVDFREGNVGSDNKVGNNLVWCARNGS